MKPKRCWNKLYFVSCIVFRVYSTPALYIVKCTLLILYCTWLDKDWDNMWKSRGCIMVNEVSREVPRPKPEGL